MYHALLISEKFDVFTKHSAEEIATLREQATAINAKLKYIFYFILLSNKLPTFMINLSFSTLHLFFKYIFMNSFLFHTIHRLLRVEALSETYSPITVNALANLRKQLENAIQKTKNDYVLATQKLEAYRSAGPEFTEIAKEYNELKKLEMNKLWAMRQIEESFNAKIAKEKLEGNNASQQSALSINDSINSFNILSEQQGQQL